MEFRMPTGPGPWESKSPDGRFIVTGYSNKGLPVLIPTMPGDGGHGPGIVILREKQTGKILQQAKVEHIDSAGGQSKVEKKPVKQNISTKLYALTFKFAKSEGRRPVAIQTAFPLILS
jgi:hypothetical protein